MISARVGVLQEVLGVKRLKQQTQDDKKKIFEIHSNKPFLLGCEVIHFS